MSCTKQYDFSGKVVIITGASSGFGSTIAKLFVMSGASVTLTGRSEEALNRVAEECREISGSMGTINCVIGNLLDDATVRQVIESTVQSFGRIDVLVNNAGGVKVVPLAPGAGASDAEIDDAFDRIMEGYDYTFALNVRSVIALTTLAVPHLESTRGCVINMSTVASNLPLGGTLSMYSVSKAALDMATKNMAVDLAKRGIRVNAINPGPCDTALHRDLLPNVEDGANAYRAFRSFTLLDRMGESHEIAALTAYLASDDAAFITGTCVLIDGGMKLKLPINMN